MIAWVAAVAAILLVSGRVGTATPEFNFVKLIGSDEVKALLVEIVKSPFLAWLAAAESDDDGKPIGNEKQLGDWAVYVTGLNHRLTDMFGALEMAAKYNKSPTGIIAALQATRDEYKQMKEKSHHLLPEVGSCPHGRIPSYDHRPMVHKGQNLNRMLKNPDNPTGSLKDPRPMDPEEYLTQIERLLSERALPVSFYDHLLVSAAALQFTARHIRHHVEKSRSGGYASFGKQLQEWLDALAPEYSGQPMPAEFVIAPPQAIVVVEKEFVKSDADEKTLRMPTLTQFFVNAVSDTLKNLRDVEAERVSPDEA